MSHDARERSTNGNGAALHFAVQWLAEKTSGPAGSFLYGSGRHGSERQPMDRTLFHLYAAHVGRAWWSGPEMPAATVQGTLWNSTDSIGQSATVTRSVRATPRHDRVALRLHGLANVLGVSCAAGPACRSRSGAAVAANDVRRTEWRTATAVTPSRWRRSRQLGCRAEAGPHQPSHQS
jgi:hypothetical protein